jgi:phosphoribosyl 1,2-cyclic phosphate phosphodiesterase
MFLEDESILFDTPEETSTQIEREKIKQIKHVFYTHWHPDHTQGMRIFSHINFSYPDEQEKEPVNVYIPENAFLDFEKFCPMLFFFEKKGYIKINKIKDRVPVKIGKITITPLDFKRKDRVRYGYLIEQNGKRVVYAPCSVFNLVLDEHYENLDLLLMEIGWFGNTKQMRAKLPKNHPWHDHVSFEENLEIMRKIKPRRTILVHIDGARHLKKDTNHDFLLKQAKKHKELNIDISYDGMKIEL